MDVLVAQRLVHPNGATNVTGWIPIWNSEIFSVNCSLAKQPSLNQI